MPNLLADPWPTKWHTLKITWYFGVMKTTNVTVNETWKLLLNRMNIMHSCMSFKIKVYNLELRLCWCDFFGCIQSATHWEQSRDPLLGCIPSTFDPPVEKHCNRLCFTHRRVTIRSTQRSREILHWFKKKNCAGIGLDRYWAILRIIGSVLKIWYCCIPRLQKSI